MAYNMSFINFPMTYNCTLANQTTVDPFLLQPHNITDYIGIEKYDESYSVVTNLKVNILFLKKLKIIY